MCLICMLIGNFTLRYGEGVKCEWVVNYKFFFKFLKIFLHHSANHRKYRLTQFIVVLYSHYVVELHFCKLAVEQTIYIIEYNS